jgi:hypothetical protein
MKLNLSDALVDIETNRTVVIHDAFDVEVVCVRGCLWVTEDRLRGDHFLRPGESRCLRSNGRALVTAMQPSTMRALEPLRRQRPSAWSRAWRAWRAAMAPAVGQDAEAGAK